MERMVCSFDTVAFFLGGGGGYKAADIIRGECAMYIDCQF